MHKTAEVKVEGDCVSSIDVCSFFYTIENYITMLGRIRERIANEVRQGGGGNPFQLNFNDNNNGKFCVCSNSV